MEEHLTECAEVMIAQQAEYREQTGKALHEVENIERRRLEFLKESILRYCQATEGMNEHLQEILFGLISKASAANMQGDVEQLERDIESIRTHTFGATRKIVESGAREGVVGSGEVVLPPDDLTTPPANDQQTEDDLIFTLRSNMLSLDRVRDALECLRLATQRATSAFIDFGEMEKHCARLTIKGLEKHGYASQRPATTYSLSASTIMKTADPKCADCVEQYELPLTSQGWCGMIELIQKVIESHHTSAAILVEKCSIMSDSTMRRLDVSLRTANDALADANKRVDNANAMQAKLSLKLSRIRKELRERRLASQAGKHVPQRHESGGDSETSDTLERESFDSEALTLTPKRRAGSVTEMVDGRSGEQARPLSATDKRRHEKGARQEKGVIHGLESLGTAFGAAAVNALGAATGVLESSTERNISRIAILEEEERICEDSLKAAVAETATVLRTCVGDLIPCVETLKGVIANEIEKLKGSYMLMLDSCMMGVNTSIAAVAKLKKCAERIDIVSDLNTFLSVVEKAHSGSLEEDRKIQLAQEVFDTHIKKFIKIENELVDLERQNEKESVAYEELLHQQETNNPGSLYAATAAAAGLRGRGFLPAAKPRRSRSVGDRGVEGGPLGSPSQVEDVADALPESNTSEGPAAINVTIAAQPSTESEAMIVPPLSISDVTSSAPLSPVHASRTSSDSVNDAEDLEKKCTQESASESTAQFVPIAEDNDDRFSSPPQEFQSDDYSHPTLLQRQQSEDTVMTSEYSQVRITTHVSDSSLEYAPHVVRMDSNSFTPGSSPPRSSSSVGKDAVGIATMGAKSPTMPQSSSGVTTPQSLSHLASPELVKFDLPADEKIVEYFSCAIYPKRGLLTHGR